MAAQVAQERVINFSAGPAVLPVPVLERVRDEMLCLPGAGASILEISHRSSDFIAVQNQAEARLRRLLAVGDEHEILFLQGGARRCAGLVDTRCARSGSRRIGNLVRTTRRFRMGRSWGVSLRRADRGLPAAARVFSHPRCGTVR